jgi:hypothetical protein
MLRFKRNYFRQKSGLFRLILLQFRQKMITTMGFHKRGHFFAENWPKSPKIVILTLTPWAFFVANLFRINCLMNRNSKSERCGILFYARSRAPLSEWCRLHWHPILRIQFHPCPCVVGQLSYISLVHVLWSIIWPRGVARFFFTQYTKTGGNVPNGH